MSVFYVSEDYSKQRQLRVRQIWGRYSSPQAAYYIVRYVYSNFHQLQKLKCSDIVLEYSSGMTECYIGTISIVCTLKKMKKDPPKRINVIKTQLCKLRVILTSSIKNN